MQRVTITVCGGGSFAPVRRRPETLVLGGGADARPRRAAVTSSGLRDELRRSRMRCTEPAALTGDAVAPRLPGMPEGGRDAHGHPRLGGAACAGGQLDHFARRRAVRA